MSDNTETPQWEPGIYQIETTDAVLGGAGGVANRPNVELGNRSAQIKDTLDLNAIFVVPGEKSFSGQNNDITASFEGSVANGDAVAWINGNLRYEKVMAPNPPTGIADISNGRVITGGLMYLNASGLTTAVAGSIIYLSGSVAGEYGIAQTTMPLGRLLWKVGSTSGIVALCLGGAGQAHSLLYDDEADKHFTEASILHSAINNDEPTIHTSANESIGHITLYVSGTSAPANYLECNGALISKTTYAALYSGYTRSIGSVFGESGGSFYLPDFRGRVPRGYDHGIGRDPDRLSRYADRAGGAVGDSPGSMQNDMYYSHVHGPPITTSSLGYLGNKPGYRTGGSGSSFGWGATTSAAGGNETRMKNFSAMWIIRYQ
jgi:hypothetical protein